MNQKDVKGRKTRNATKTDKAKCQSRLSFRISENDLQKLELLAHSKGCLVAELARVAVYSLVSQFDEEFYNDVREELGVLPKTEESVGNMGRIEEFIERKFMNDELVYSRQQKDVYEYSDDSEYIREMFNELMEG
jgi:Rad3-related DNA helicase